MEKFTIESGELGNQNKLIIPIIFKKHSILINDSLVEFNNLLSKVISTEEFMDHFELLKKESPFFTNPIDDIFSHEISFFEIDKEFNKYLGIIKNVESQLVDSNKEHTKNLTNNLNLLFSHVENFKEIMKATSKSFDDHQANMRRRINYSHLADELRGNMIKIHDQQIYNDKRFEEIRILLDQVRKDNGETTKEIVSAQTTDVFGKIVVKIDEFQANKYGRIVGLTTLAVSSVMNFATLDISEGVSKIKELCLQIYKIRQE